MNTSWVIAKKNLPAEDIQPYPSVSRASICSSYQVVETSTWPLKVDSPCWSSTTEFRRWFKQCLFIKLLWKTQNTTCILWNILYFAVILVYSGSEELIYSWNNISTSCLLKNIRIYPRIKLCSSRYQEPIHIHIQYRFFSQKQHNVRFPVCSFPPLPFLCLFNIHPHFHGKRTAPTTSDSSQVVPKGFLQLGLPPPLWGAIWNRFVSTPAKRESIKTAEGVESHSEETLLPNPSTTTTKFCRTRTIKCEEFCVLVIETWQGLDDFAVGTTKIEDMQS